MSRSYDLNTQAAQKADEKGGRIADTGEYIGIFKYAIATQSGKGTDGIELHFESEGKEARLPVWTHDKDGKELSGNNIINAIMTCMALRSLKPKSQQVEVWDRESNSKVKKQAECFPDLQGKRIGLLLQLAPEEYMKNNQIAVANKIEIYGVFAADSRLVASEILGRIQTPAKLDKMKSVLKDRAMKRLPIGNGSASRHQDAAPSGNFIDFEDDIPF